MILATKDAKETKVIWRWGDAPCSGCLTITIAGDLLAG